MSEPSRGIDDSPLVSIVLVTKNGGDRLAALLDALSRQHTDFRFETVAVDSGSTDGSLQCLDAAGVRVERIEPQTFNHGATRNRAIAMTTGTYVVLVVQDAVPTSPDWLARLVEPLRRDATIAGTYARQDVWPDASAITAHYHGRWSAAARGPRREQFAHAADLDALAPPARLGAATFDNVCACIRRSVWEEVPFPVAPVAEDVEWAWAVLRAGHALEYVPDAAVWHSHERSARYELARTVLVHHRLAQLFGLHTIPGLPQLTGAVAGSVRLHMALEAGARRHGRGAAGYGRALALAVAWPLGQYLGGRAAARNVEPIRWDTV